MKIKVEHISNTYNYGSLMMAVNFINNLKDQFKEKELEFYVDTKTEKDLERVKQESKYDKIFMYKNVVLNNGDSSLRTLKNNINNDSKKFDALIVLGGDDISEYYGKKPLLKELIRVYLYSKKMPVFLVGQTVGPFSKYTKLAAKLVLKRTNLYTRDYKCLQYLEQMGVNNAFDSRDLAFIHLPLQNNEELKENILNKYGLKDKKYITIVPSGLTFLYTQNPSNYIECQVEMIEKILQKDQLHDTSIVLLPHVLLPEHVDDRKMICEIIKRLDKKYVHRVIAIQDEVLSTEARHILGNGIFTITGRMHAAVSTFQMKKPALSLSYSVKYSGVIGDGLKMNDLIIESACEELWQNTKIVNLVDEKVDYILNRYEDIINNINSIMPEVEAKVYNQIYDIAEKLNNNKVV